VRGNVVRLLPLVLLVGAAGCSAPPDLDSPGSTASGSTDAATLSEQERCDAEFTAFPSRIPTQDGCRCPHKAGCGPPESNATFPFTANRTRVPSNGSVQVTVVNDTDHNLTYWRTARCPVEAWASDGRQLWTMCGSDAIMTLRIPPGGTDDSFFWRAVECLEGESTGFTQRCTKERPLAMGTYRLRQAFCPFTDECGSVWAGLEVQVVA
jgi:hypothetical protein